MALRPPALFLIAAATLAVVPTSYGDPAEAADRAYEMGMKYAGRGYYLAPSKEGHAGADATLEFEVPVNRGLDYIFIVAGDRYALDIDVWVEAEISGNEIVKDTRKVDNGLAGVRWRSDYNGVVLVVVHFAKVKSRSGWAALVGRRGTAIAPFQPGIPSAENRNSPAAKIHLVAREPMLAKAS